MDEFQQIGPDKPDYLFDLELVKRGYRTGIPVAVRFAARATAATIVIVPWHTFAAMGKPAGFVTTDPVFVAVVGAGGKAAFLPADAYLHPAYVAQYLGTPFGDGPELADFLNTVLGHRPQPQYTAEMAATT